MKKKYIYHFFKFKNYFKNENYKQYGHFFKLNELKHLMLFKLLFLNKYILKYLYNFKIHNKFIKILDSRHPIIKFKHIKYSMFKHYFNDILFTPWMTYICIALIGCFGIFFLFMEVINIHSISQIQVYTIYLGHLIILFAFIDACYLHGDLFDYLYLENATIRGIRYIYGWEHRYKVFKPVATIHNIKFEELIDTYDWDPLLHMGYDPVTGKDNIFPNENWPDWGYESNTFVPNWWEMHTIGDLHQLYVVQVLCALILSMTVFGFYLWNDIYMIDRLSFLFQSKYYIILNIVIFMYIILNASAILSRNNIIEFDIRIFRHVIKKMFYRPYWYHGKWENLSLGQERGLYNYNLSYWNRRNNFYAESDYIPLRFITYGSELEWMRHTFIMGMYAYFLLLQSFGTLAPLIILKLTLFHLDLFILSLFYLFKFIILFLFLYGISGWIQEIIIESVYLGKYNIKIRSTLVCGFFLFLISEIMLFGGLFWAYFDRIFNLTEFTEHLSIPLGMERVRLLELPLLGLLVLIVSGFCGNNSYYALRIGNYFTTISNSLYSILFGIIFLLIQFTEYVELQYAINDSVFGSLFYMLTGFHGMHVIIGLLLLIINYMRLKHGNFSKQRNTGPALALFYWHFVDIIWIFLIISLYFMNHGIIFTSSGELELFGSDHLLKFISFDNELFIFSKVK